MTRSNVGKRKPTRSASPLVRALFDAVEVSGKNYRDIGYAAGIDYKSLSMWKHGHHAPRLVDFENVAQVLGYSIELTPIDVDNGL